MSDETIPPGPGAPPPPPAPEPSTPPGPNPSAAPPPPVVGAPSTPPAPHTQGVGAPPPPTPPPSPMGPGGGDNRNLMLILAYLWFLGLIPYLMEKDDAELQWHSKNGLVLLGVELIAWVVLTILTAIPGIGCIAVFLWFPVAIIALILRIMAISKALKGERFIIPMVSEYTHLLP